MRLGACLIVVMACGIPALDGSDKECPCATGYVCDEARNRCVELDAGDDDAGADEDAGRDASFDVGVDAMDRDAGADEDAGRNDAGTDSGGDSGPPPRDVGPDVPDLPDTGPGTCPRDGLYCTNFEESPPPYVRRAGGTFSERAPGYMSDEAGYYTNTGGEAVLTEFDSVTLPDTFYIRFWYRIEFGSFNTESAVFGAFLPGGTDAGVAIFLQNTDGLITVSAVAGAGGIVGGMVSDTYGPPGDMWTCIRLDIRPNGLDLEINEQGEVSTGFPPLPGSYDDISWGILEDGIDESTIVFDQILVSTSPIPCDVP